MKNEKSMLRFERIKILLSLSLAIISLIVFFVFFELKDGKTNGKTKALEKYQKTVNSSKYIVHALGGMKDEKSDGSVERHNYINSIDCLKKAYNDGYRLFEADISFTSDGVLVLAHSGENNVWSKNDWELRLGQEYPFIEENQEIIARNGYDFNNYDKEKHLATLQDFMNFKIQGKYRATSFAELLDFMEDHKDMYVMVDAGCRSYEDTCVYYKEIVNAANGRTEVLDRLIAGGQTTEMVSAAREAYDFPLINLYYASDEKREKIIFTPEEFIGYCEMNHITSFSVAKEVYTENVAQKLEESDLISYVFTVNEEDEAETLRDYGADVIGTDFLYD